MNHLKLETLTMSELVVIHNALLDAGTKGASGKTFSQRSKAIEKIMKLAGAKGIDPATYFLEDGSVRPQEAPKPKADVKAKPKKEKKEKGPSIRSVAEDLLMRITGQDEDKRPVGMSYEEVLICIRDKYPEAKTTVACLRWYAVHMRERNIMPPGRPRALANSVGADQGKGTQTDKEEEEDGTKQALAEVQ